MGVDATIVGSAGVALLLLAFFLNLLHFQRADNPLYLVLNLVNAALACLSSYLIDFMPFVLLKGTWAVVAAVALWRRLLSARGPAA